MTRLHRQVWRVFGYVLGFTWAVTSARAEQYLRGVTATASSEQVKGLTGAENLVNDHGFAETRPGSGQLALTKNGYADGGTSWHSNHLKSGPQENPLVDFDLGQQTTLFGCRVWNKNDEPNRGFREVTVYASDDRKRWRTVGRFTFARAPGEDGYLGEAHKFKAPVKARHIRFWAESSYRGGQPDVAGLGKVRFIEAPTGTAAQTNPSPPIGPFPADAGAVDVKEAPFNARGDGATDDTAAIQKAVDTLQGTGRYVYLPAGTYLVTRPIRIEPAKAYGRNNLRGAGRGKTVLRLKDYAFTDATRPQAVFSNGFNGAEGGHVSADWFFNHMSDFTIDTGKGNPGAVGLRFYSNNVGRLSDVTIRSGDGAGVIGLDLGAIDQNGPLLVKDVTVIGFDTGVRTAAGVNSQTIESLRLEGQRKVGLSGSGQCLSIRDVVSRNAVPAMTFEYGVVALVDAELTGLGDNAAKLDAITSGEELFARNIRAPGYARAIRNADSRKGRAIAPGPQGVDVGEYVSAAPLTMRGAPPRSLGLPVKEAPATPAQDDPSTWANARHYRLISDPDDTPALQRAIDSGARTVYLPPGAAYELSGPVEIRGKTRRLAGMFSRVRAVSKEAGIRIAAGDASAVFVEDLTCEAPITNPSGRTLVLRNGELAGGSADDAGELFIENVVCAWTFGERQRVWARQLNAESEGTHLTNAGGSLWVLGLKTERGGTLIDTKQGGRTELVGGLSYTTTQGKLAPMFTVEPGGELSATIGEVCFTGDPYAAIAKAGSEVLTRGQAPLRPEFLHGSVLPLLRVGAGGMK